METEKLFEYLRNFVNQAVQRGGFTANDARNGLNVLDQLEQKFKDMQQTAEKPKK